MELLAPVNTETLRPALAAGADAVYFGLKRLNARRGALNFSQSELPEAVRLIHAAGAKAHLTLNIDLAQNEIGLAARMLHCAAECKVDAVIVRDPALFALRPFFPALQFHLSTQAAVTTPAGVEAASRLLHCERVVLARELTVAEITECAKVPDVETEVFIQGAICFSCSGRCLLSSWVGGRSGNRGACASPCRVEWQSADRKTPFHPLSMHDLCLLEHLGELQKCGVASLKIEGRLKSARWVSHAVTLYRQAMKTPERLSQLRQEAELLGNYTGRRFTDGYFNGNFASLTDSDRGRTAGSAAPPPNSSGNAAGDETAPPEAFILASKTDPDGAIVLSMSYGGCSDTFRIPPQRIASPKRALPLGEIIEDCLCSLPQPLRLIPVDNRCQDPDCRQLLPRRWHDTVGEAISQFLRQATKEDDGVVRIELPRKVRDFLEQVRALPRTPANNRHLGSEADSLRLTYSQLVLQSAELAGSLGRFRRIAVALPSPPPDFTELAAALQKLPSALNLRIALPAVCYARSLPQWRKIIRAAHAASVGIEVNSWDTLWLAHTENVPFETGPGMAVLNSMASHFLAGCGAQCVTVSPEIDREKLELLCAASPTPLNLIVYGHPPLMTTRAVLPGTAAPSGCSPGAILTDRRNTAMRAWPEGEVTVLRPLRPYDWRTLSNRRIQVAHLETDLSGAAAGELASPADFRFNYDRELR